MPCVVLLLALSASAAATRIPDWLRERPPGVAQGVHDTCLSWLSEWASADRGPAPGSWDCRCLEFMKTCGQEFVGKQDPTTAGAPAFRAYGWWEMRQAEQYQEHGCELGAGPADEFIMKKAREAHLRDYHSGAK